MNKTLGSDSEEDHSDAEDKTEREKREADKLAEKRHKRRMKGTLFAKCQDNHDLFNTNRLAKNNIK